MPSFIGDLLQLLESLKETLASIADRDDPMAANMAEEALAEIELFLQGVTIGDLSEIDLPEIPSGGPD